MRHEGTDAEKKFWLRVRDRRLHGYKFKRQVLIGNYIADFACIETHLVVELDGGQHNVQRANDARRDAVLATHGFRIIRFWNNDVLSNMEGVLLQVTEALKTGTPSP